MTIVETTVNFKVLYFVRLNSLPKDKILDMSKLHENILQMTKKELSQTLNLLKKW